MYKTPYPYNLTLASKLSITYYVTGHKITHFKNM